MLDLLAAVLVLYSVSADFSVQLQHGQPDGLAADGLRGRRTPCSAARSACGFPRAQDGSFSGCWPFWPGVYLALIAFVSVSGYMNPPTGEERVIIVLGAGLHKDKPSKLLQCRLNKAYDYAAAHPDTLVITSGGQGRDEWLPEGDAMRDYLIAKGLPADRVLAESGSTSTEENFAFSLTILREHGFDETTPIVYVSNAFHCYRAGKYAALAGFTKATALPAAHAVAQRAAMLSAGGTWHWLYYWVFKTSASPDRCMRWLACWN